MLTARCGLDADAVRVPIALTVKWPSSLAPTAASGSVPRSTLCAGVRKEMLWGGGGGGRGGSAYKKKKTKIIENY